MAKQTSSDVSALAGKWMQRAQSWGGVSCYRYVDKDDVQELISICASCLSQDEVGEDETAGEVSQPPAKRGRPPKKKK